MALDTTLFDSDLTFWGWSCTTPNELFARLADELALFVAPKVLGVNAKTAFACDEVSSLDCLKPYKILTIKRSGKDFFVRALLA